MASSTGSSTETSVQSIIHALEQGNLAFLVRGIVLLVCILAVALCFLGWKFRGFALPEAMDQAQIGSEFVAGHGWSTRFLRPLAISQIEKNSGPIQRGHLPDTFNAPLPPLLDAVAIKLAGNHMEFKRAEYIAPAERFIVALSMLCFLGAVVLQYFLVRRVFDERLAFWSVLLTLACDLCWRFTLSGLPQMLMMLLFNAALYTLVRAIEAQIVVDRSGELLNAETGETAPYRRPETVFGWLLATGTFFGLLALTHGLAIWLFVGALVFSALYFRQRAVCVLALLFMFSLCYAPWLIRNYEVCGNAFGVAGYAVYDGVGGSTMGRMRSPNGAMTDGIELYYFRTKIADGVVNQVGSLLHNLGDNILALGFFVCLMHVFRRREVNALKWAVLLMWLAAVFGMALLGNNDMAVPVGANQLGILFLPIMLGFGLAFVLVLFSRRDGDSGATARVVLFTVLFLISSFPLVFDLLPRNVPPVQYPPYLEPAINKLADWTRPDEIIGSDMPWAVAWYADRPSVWIPNKLADFMGLSDYARLPGPLAGLFLTTLSRNEPFYMSIYRGEYQDWQPLIFGRADVPSFPFKESVNMLGDLSYSFYSDSKRWEHVNAAPAEP